MLGYLRSGNKRTKIVWWVITVATVFTFLLGFSFYGGFGDQSKAARASGAYGMINGEKVTKELWQTAVNTEHQRYFLQFGTEPIDRDLRAVEQRAWRGLVNTRLLVQEGRKAGLGCTDNDVMTTMLTDPPLVVTSSPVFATNGKFDPQKYMTALRNPGNNWAALEAEVRDEMPGKKLQEMIVGSAKFSESELREAFANRFTRINAVVVQVPPADSAKAADGDAEMQRIYDKYRSLFASPARTQVEMLQLPVEYSPDEIKSGMDVATGLYQRIMKGESFDQVCKDYSEGLNAERGGVIDRWLDPRQMGPAGAVLAAHKPGDIVEPQREGGTIMIFRILDPARDSLARNGAPGQIKLAQITVKLRPASESLRSQYERAAALAKDAGRIGLGKAATAKGLSTMKSGFFDLDNMPQQLYDTPEAADWAVAHKKGDVSPVFQSPDAFLIEQVVVNQPAGIPSREDLADQLKQIAQFDARVEKSKARADQVAAAVRAGQSLEDAAKASGLQAMPVSFTHAEPDPRLMRSPELMGALWTAKPGQVVGPVKTPVGYFFGRTVGVSAPPDSLWNNQQMRTQLTNDIVTRRQTSVVNGVMGMLRDRSKIVDNRSAFAQ